MYEEKRKEGGKRKDEMIREEKRQRGTDDIGKVNKEEKIGIEKSFCLLLCSLFIDYENVIRQTFQSCLISIGTSVKATCTFVYVMQP